jgi:Mg2+/citrate symporter
MSYPYFFASPDLSGMGDALLLIGTVLPIFAFGALCGINVGLGILQAVLLLLAELIQWQLTRRAKLTVRVISFICTYFIVNIGFVLAVFCPWGRN